MKSIMTLTTTVVCALTLSACGGGGGDSSPIVTPGTSQSGNSSATGNGGSSASPDVTPNGGSSNNNSGPFVFVYEATQSAADVNGFLMLINKEGAKGYRHLNDNRDLPATDGTSMSRSQSIFIKDSVVPSYTYKVLPLSEYNFHYNDYINVAEFVKQNNTEGAKGYRYVRDYYDK